MTHDTLDLQKKTATSPPSRVDHPLLPSQQPVLTPEGWTLIAAFGADFACSRVWFRDVEGQRQFMVDIDRSGFDWIFDEEDDWRMFPRYERGDVRLKLKLALRDADSPWVLAMPIARVHSDYAAYFAAGIIEASAVEDTFTGAWLSACQANRDD